MVEICGRTKTGWWISSMGSWRWCGVSCRRILKMSVSNSPLIDQFAGQLNLQVKRDPLHGVQGIELRRKLSSSDSLVCIGYFYNDQHCAEIYRMVRSKRD